MNIGSLSDDSLPWVLAFNALAHEIGVPLPLTPTALFAGARVSQGHANAAGLVLVIVGATLISNTVWYGAGRAFGSSVLKALCKISLSQDTCVGRTELAFTRWGRWSLVFGHFIPGVSLIAPPLAGALGMSWPAFLGFTALGAVLHGVVLIGAGMLLSEGILALADTLLAHGGQSLAAIVLVLVAYVAWKWWRRRMAARSLQAPRVGVTG